MQKGITERTAAELRPGKTQDHTPGIYAGVRLFDCLRIVCRMLK